MTPNFRYFLYGLIAMMLIGYGINVRADDVVQWNCEPEHVRLSTNRVAETATMCAHQNCVTAALQEITQRYRPYPMLLVHYATLDDRHIAMHQRPGHPLQVKLIEPTTGGSTVTAATCNRKVPTSS